MSPDRLASEASVPSGEGPAKDKATGCDGEGSRPILFLDFDGVLNRRGTTTRFQFPNGAWFTGLDAGNMDRLNRVMRDVPEARIVVSSTWRTVLGVAALRGALCEFGFKYPERVIDRTPRWRLHASAYIAGAYAARGHEIQAWLDERGVKPSAIAILDDAEDMVHLSGRLVRTDFEEGMSEADADAVIALLAVQPASGTVNATVTPGAEAFEVIDPVRR